MTAGNDSLARRRHLRGIDGIRRKLDPGEPLLFDPAV